MHKRVYESLQRYDILYDSQYGFRPQHNTINAVSHLASHIPTQFDENKFTLGMFLDLSKAFDTIDLLLSWQKWNIMGYGGWPWSGSGAIWWIENYMFLLKVMIQLCTT